MKRITRSELVEILEEHKKWLCEDGGKRANLRCADLRGANLRHADLGGASLSDANLYKADLNGADLRSADLRYCNAEFVKGQKVISVQVDTSRKNNRISYWADLGVWTTGCFQGSLEELKESIKETHKDNLKLKTRYERVIEFILSESEVEE